MEVRWEDPGVRARFEDLVAVLISWLYPNAQRIDGSGGDGGRDVQVPTDEGPLIFELKSFTGRISEGGRKGQITRSLARAAEHNPAAWRLVVPIDPTPAELAWFEEMTAPYPFECIWRGRTWLNSELACRPAIVRYFLEDYETEVLQLLKDLKGEEGDVGNAVAAVQRARAIRKRLNDLDPYYEYALSIGAGMGSRPRGTVLSVHVGTDRIDVIPRFATAVRDRPITVNLDLSFDASTAFLQEQFERSLDFGDPVELPKAVVQRVTIDAPAGLSDEMTEGAFIRLGGLVEELDEPAIVHAEVIAPDGETTLSTLEFSLDRRTGGRRGVVLQGTDASGLLTLEARLVADDRQLQSNFTYSMVPVLPLVGLEVARWIEQVRPPNRLRLKFITPAAGTADADIGKQLGDSALVELFEAFQTVQQHAGVSFPIPDDLTDDEWADISKAAQWLSPDKREFRWSTHQLKLSGVPAQGLDQLLAPEGSTLFMKVEDTYLDFRGRKLRLGTLATTVTSLVATNAAEVRAAVQRGKQDLTIDLIPGKSDVGYEWLLSADDPLQDA